MYNVLLHTRFFILVTCILFGVMGCQNRTAPLKLAPLTEQNVKEELLKFGRENPETVVLISTSMGEIKVKLYKETPLHRANFIRLVKMGFYNKTVFHRVLNHATVQGGDARVEKMEIGDYTVPNEVNPRLYHKRGALAMARYDDEHNPTRASSSDNFYIVQGSRVGLETLQEMEQKHHFKYTPAQIKTYTSIGGMPTLDMVYTVFGEVLEGMDVVDKIAAVPVDLQDWPSKEIYMTMEVIE